MKKECLICTGNGTDVCPYCKNEYCALHFKWHLTNNKVCRKSYEKDHGKMKDEE
jgi:hypothetical protein